MIKPIFNDFSFSALTYAAISFLFVAFGQPAWIPWFGPIAASLGFSLFWRGMLFLKSARQRFFLATLWFFSVQAVQFSWFATIEYMGPFILIVYFLLNLAMGLQFGILSLLVKERVSAIFALSSLWTVFEWLRGFFLSGFSWNQVGLFLCSFSSSLQLASLGGIFFLSFWVMVVNLFGLKVLLEKTRRNRAVFILLASFPYIFGGLYQGFIPKKEMKSLQVVLLQSNVFPEQREPVKESLKEYIPPIKQWERLLGALDLSRKVDLVVFPEGAIPLSAHAAGYNLSEVKKFLSPKFFPPLQSPFAYFNGTSWKVSNVFIAQALANQLGAEVILGMDDRDVSGVYNAAFHFTPNGNSYSRYEKQVLVPLGEYVPGGGFKKIANFIARKFGIYGAFDPGKGGKVFQFSTPIGISICVEETFGSLIRNLRLEGAELFVNITNDVWFPKSKLAEQHFYHGRVRSVENGVGVLRASNTGVTCALDCFGKLLEKLPIHGRTPEALYLEMPISSYKTPYVFWGDFAILFVCAIFIGSFLFSRLRVQETVAVNESLS